jgi:hypothetical protein
MFLYLHALYLNLVQARRLLSPEGRSIMKTATIDKMAYGLWQPDGGSALSTENESNDAAAKRRPLETVTVKTVAVESGHHNEMRK